MNAVADSLGMKGRPGSRHPFRAGIPRPTRLLSPAALMSLPTLRKPGRLFPFVTMKTLAFSLLTLGSAIAVHAQPVTRIAQEVADGNYRMVERGPHHSETGLRPGELSTG